MAVVLTFKAPGERVDYEWFPPLDAGDTITGAPTVTRQSGTANLDSATLIGTASVRLWFTAGADGETSTFLGEVTTAGGRTWQETFILPVNSTALSTIGQQLVQIFPAFASVAASLIDYWIDRAALVTAGWADDHATMLLACHYMVMNGLGTGTAAELAASGLSGVKSLKSGTLSLDFGDGAAASAKGDYNATSYGRQFYPLMLSRVAGTRIMSTGAVNFIPRTTP